MPRRIPFDAAWGFDCHEDFDDGNADSSFHLIEGDSLSLEYEDESHHHHDRRLFDPLPLDMDPTFEVLRPDDTASATGDNVSTVSGATGLGTSCLWPGQHPVTSKGNEGDYHPAAMEFHEITCSSSHSAEAIEDADPLSFGPRGTQTMMTFMRRSEETRVAIIDNLRSLPIDSAVALDTNIKHFFKTKDSRERLMTSFQRGNRRHDGSATKKSRQDTCVSHSESDL